MTQAALQFRVPESACSTARPAMVVPRDGDLVLAAAEGGFEPEIDGEVQIGAALGFASLGAHLRREELGEEVAEGRRRRTANADRKIETFEAVDLGLPLNTGAGDIVLMTAVGIAQRLVRFGDASELGRREPVAGVDIRVIPAG